MKEKYGESAIYIARSFPLIAIGRIQRYPRVLIRATVNSKILIESWFRHSHRQTRGSPGDGFIPIRLQQEVTGCLLLVLLCIRDSRSLNKRNRGNKHPYSGRKKVLNETGLPLGWGETHSITATE